MNEKNSPIITLGGNYDETTVAKGKIDTKISVATYEATDDTTNVMYVNVMAISPFGEISAVTEGFFIPRATGDWKIVYYCYDECGNTTTRYYTVSVS